jgi:hypothetical protein
MCPLILSKIGDFLAKNPQWLAFFLYSLFEHFLGKSKKVESNSLIALVWNIIRRRKP